MITNIGLDHTDWLGDTIEKLLLKSRYYPTSYSCHFAGEQSLPQAIQDKANSSQATLYAINRDYFINSPMMENIGILQVKEPL